MHKSIRSFIYFIFHLVILSSCSDSDKIPYHVNEIEFLNGNIKIISISSKSYETDSTNYYYSKNHELEKILVFKDGKVEMTYDKHKLNPENNLSYFGTYDYDSLFNGYVIMEKTKNSLPAIYNSYYSGKLYSQTKFYYKHNKISHKEDFSFEDSTIRNCNYEYDNGLLVKIECNTGIDKILSEYELDHFKNPISWKEGYYDGNTLRGKSDQLQRNYTYY
ncbi:hypothetical protein [Flammeovirga sp. SJP92]|uniref:hypothetical protein n=1 Tax=Flammeovirga sp. SJP92 TaxID=1775430 RepID=UPI00078945D9|nr:hypothetical protein [Flammeovirga sp. SJP92]KXX69117.1 hypothetical protein AVL50_16905 [Flammeovirga sp. SJP92]